MVNFHNHSHFSIIWVWPKMPLWARSTQSMTEMFLLLRLLRCKWGRCTAVPPHLTWDQINNRLSPAHVVLHIQSRHMPFTLLPVYSQFTELNEEKKMFHCLYNIIQCKSLSHNSLFNLPFSLKSATLLTHISVIKTTFSTNVLFHIQVKSTELASVTADDLKVFACWKVLF